MKSAELLMFGAMVAFGLWWLVLPGSAIRFYSWFSAGRVRVPAGTAGIRVTGALWIALVVAATFLGRR
jgi:hypothetical protein